MSRLHTVEAEVLSEVNGIYRLKVSVLDLGMYITGFTVRKSKLNEDWWIQPPSKMIKPNVYKRDIEFDKNKSLWQEIDKACKDVVDMEVALVDGVSIKDVPWMED